MIRLFSNLKNRRGFTLIELIVVLAVLAIIIAIAVPRFVGVRESATIDSDLSTVASIAKLVELQIARENISTAQTGADKIGSKTINDLIIENFDEANLFQTNNLKNLTYSGTGAVTVEVDYNDQGTVTKVTIDGTTDYVFTKSGSKFTTADTLM